MEQRDVGLSSCVESEIAARHQETADLFSIFQSKFFRVARQDVGTCLFPNFLQVFKTLWKNIYHI